MKKPEASFDEPIGDILRQGPRKLLAKVLQVEVASFMALYADLKDVQCRQRVTHNGWYLPEGKFKPVLDQFSIQSLSKSEFLSFGNYCLVIHQVVLLSNLFDTSISFFYTINQNQH